MNDPHEMLGSPRPQDESLRVAFIGQRGLPATYGGIERHVEEIGSRLVARGHDVTVFCRTNYVRDRRAVYRGMHLRHLPAVSSKHLEAILHSGLSTLDALRGFDIVHYHALGPGLFAPLPRYLSKARVVLTVHGFDQERAKWGKGAAAVLGMAAWMSKRIPDTTIVVSRALYDHYSAHGARVVHIPNGVSRPSESSLLEKRDSFGLGGSDYFLFVGRLVPEKAPDLLVRAFRTLPVDMRLVIVGGTSYTDDYVDRLRSLADADSRVVLTGYVYGAALDELYANAAAFVLPSLLEGLPLTLLEAASYGTPVVASAIPPHVEVLREDGPGHRLFDPGDEGGLVAALERTLTEPEREREGAAVVRSRVLREYSWDVSTAATEAVYRKLLSGDNGRSAK